jgi:transposase
MIKDMREKGMSISDISRQLGIDRKTVRKYINSNRVPKQSRRKRKTKLDPCKPIIRMFIDKYNLSAVRILEEIKGIGYDGSYTTVKNYCRTIRKERSIKAVYRFETEYRNYQQVDLGSFGNIDIDGRSVKLYAFSYILGYSRYRYVEFTTDIRTENIIKLHISAFVNTGGIPSEILYDNMKQVVIDRKLNEHESRFNSLFTQFS